jgi:hypothetical protein
MSIDQTLIDAAEGIEQSVSAPPLQSIQARAHRRQVRSWTTIGSTTLVLAGVAAAAVVAWPDSTPRTAVKITPAAPSTPTALDFTATVLPPGLSYISTEHGPPNQFEELIKRYADSSRSHYLIIDVNRGVVMTPKFYANESSGFTLTTIDGHPAAVRDGRTTSFSTEVFVQIARDITVEVQDRGDLSLSQVIDIERGVRVNQ